jgi:hypothetical protein
MIEGSNIDDLIDIFHKPTFYKDVSVFKYEMALKLISC